MKGGAETYIGAGAAAITAAGVGGAALLNDLRQKENRAMYLLRVMITKCLNGKSLPYDKNISIMRDLLRYLKTTPMIKRVRFKWENQVAQKMLAEVGPLPLFNENITDYQAITDKYGIIDGLK